jgi:hypothetical protein
LSRAACGNSQFDSAQAGCGASAQAETIVIASNRWWRLFVNSFPFELRSSQQQFAIGLRIVSGSGGRRMQITSQMFESYLCCPFKCFQHRDGVVGQVTESSEWQRQTQQRYEEAAWRRLCASLPSDETFVGNPALNDLRSYRYKLVGAYEVSTSELRSRLNAIQLTNCDSGENHH